MKGHASVRPFQEAAGLGLRFQGGLPGGGEAWSAPHGTGGFMDEGGEMGWPRRAQTGCGGGWAGGGSWGLGGTWSPDNKHLFLLSPTVPVL